MKKFLLAIALIAGLSVAASASDTYSHDASVLPEAAKSTITNNFKATVSVVKIEKKFGRVEDYEVILTDGSEIEFDRNGNWKNVETAKTKSVPAAFVPQGVRDFVKSNHSGSNIVGIEKVRKGYEVELSNGIDMKFTADGKFIRYDD